MLSCRMVGEERARFLPERLGQACLRRWHLRKDLKEPWERVSGGNMPGRGTTSAAGLHWGCHSRPFQEPHEAQGGWGGVGKGGWLEMRTGGKKGPHHRDPEGP